VEVVALFCWWQQAGLSSEAAFEKMEKEELKSIARGQSDKAGPHISTSGMAGCFMPQDNHAKYSGTGHKRYICREGIC
jgi:hypothetical protein